ncbi:MAG: hypothetical protein H5T86_13890, partial [Armatimonadetes bacterium]|nr:hypothetical protein [Armatimonadota bacterium]
MIRGLAHVLCSKEGRGTTSTPEDTGAKRRRAGASAGLIALVCLGLAPLVHAQVPDFDRNGVADEADLVYFIRQYAQRAGNWDRNVDLKQDSILNHEDALRMIDALLQAGSAEAIQLAATLRATGEKFLEIGQASPRDPDLQGFAAWLRARDDVAQAEVQGGGVAATTKTGVNLLFTVRPTGALGIPSVAPVSDTASCLLAFASSGQVRPADITCLGELVPRGEALLIDVVHDDPCAFIPDVREMLRRAGYTCMEKPPGLPSFGYMKDAELTVVKSHGGVWQDSRGADHFWFFATYTFLEQPIPDLSPYLRELRDGSLLVGYSLEVNQQTNQVEGATRFVGIVADKWFPRYVGAVPRNAAVFFIMCDSAALDEPARTFFGMGAQAYFGFTHTVRNNWGTAWLKKYLDRLTGSNTTDEWDRPPRRPQNFRDAFDYVRSHTGYSVDSAWGARAKLSLADNPESKFALSPYIGYAFLEWTLENHNNLFLSGAFGCRPSVYIDSSALPVFYAGAGGGQPVGVRIARDTAGEVWVKAEDGRATNRVVVSQLQAD